MCRLVREANFGTEIVVSSNAQKLILIVVSGKTDFEQVLRALLKDESRLEQQQCRNLQLLTTIAVAHCSQQLEYQQQQLLLDFFAVVKAACNNVQ